MTIFSQHASTGAVLTRKGEDSGAALQDGLTSSRPAASSPCATENRPAEAFTGGRTTSRRGLPGGCPRRSSHLSHGALTTARGGPAGQSRDNRPLVRSLVDHAGDDPIPARSSAPSPSAPAADACLKGTRCEGGNPAPPLPGPLARGAVGYAPGSPLPCRSSRGAL